MKAVFVKSAVIQDKQGLLDFEEFCLLAHALFGEGPSQTATVSTR